MYRLHFLCVFASHFGELCQNLKISCLRMISFKTAYARKGSDQGKTIEDKFSTYLPILRLKFGQLSSFCEYFCFYTSQHLLFSRERFTTHYLYSIICTLEEIVTWERGLRSFTLPQLIRLATVNKVIYHKQQKSGFQVSVRVCRMVESYPIF
jgi:hypothetical protein